MAKDKEKDTANVGIAASGGHPRRECPELLKENGIVAVLKGKGKGTGKGYKGGKCYKGGKGNGYGDGTSGKGKVGYNRKGLNYYGEEDYHSAWGNDDYSYDDWNWGGENYYVGGWQYKYDDGKGRSGKTGRRKGRSVGSTANPGGNPA